MCLCVGVYISECTFFNGDVCIYTHFKHIYIHKFPHNTSPHTRVEFSPTSLYHRKSTKKKIVIKIYKDITL